jgi:hypothetical protein
MGQMHLEDHPAILATVLQPWLLWVCFPSLLCNVDNGYPSSHSTVPVHQAKNHVHHPALAHL